MIDKIFDFCVDLLEWTAEKLGITYQQINVILFVILMPITFLLLIVLLIIKW